MPDEGRSTRGGLRAAFGEALSEELSRLELIASRGWQLLALAGVLISVALMLTVSRALGAGTLVLSVFYLVWFTIAASRFRRNVAGAALVGGTSLVEIVAPWMFGSVMVVTQGAAYALGSWVPPMLFCGLIVASTVRLRPWPPAVQGLVGGSSYLVFYFAFARARLTPEQAEFVLYKPGIQITRALSIGIAGVAGSLVAIGLRGAIGRADAAVRERDLFGKYRLLRTIASGGMGEVVEALYCPEGGFERRVAVKRVHPHLAEQKAFVDAFRAEAELCAYLSHPNVVQVFDFGKVGSTYFLAMEHVDGLTLARLMSRARGADLRVPIDVAVFVARQLLAGLAYSHEIAKGADGRTLRVVHRDLCPQNVLLSRSGEVKITDFGIARALGEAATAHTRAPRGHVAYLAPEQLRALEITPSADLFAVGVVLWELVTGARLFARGSEAATLTAVLAAHVPPASALRPDLDPEFDAFFARALDEDPRARFASATAMARALEALPGAIGERAGEHLAELVATTLALDDAEEVPTDDAPTMDA